jgi:hypothetical protein
MSPHLRISIKELMTYLRNYGTRSNIAFVTGMLDRYQKNPDKPHWDRVKKALTYLQGTKGLMSMYKKSDAPLEIVGYSDSDFACWLDIEKSTSGYIFTLTNRVISWKTPNKLSLHR